MDWANERFNQITTDIQCADENSLHPAQNLHALLPQYCAGSGPGAVPADTILDDAHQSNELLQARSHFGNLLNEPQSASTAVCTEPQYRPNPQTPPTFIDLQCDTFQNQQSLVPLDHQSNVSSLGQPQFRLNDTFHNHLQSSAFSGLGDPPHIFDDQESLAPLDSQNDISPAQSQLGLGNLPYIFDNQQSLQSNAFSGLDEQSLDSQTDVLPAQSQSGLGNLPYIFDDQQSLYNQPQNSVFAQPHVNLGDFPHIFDDQQSLASSASQLDILLVQPQSGLSDSPHIFDNQQSLYNQPQNSVFAQPQGNLSDFPHIFDDQQSLAPFASQLQSGVLPAQLQSGHFENLSHQQFSAAFINSGGNILLNPAHFPNEQSSSIVIPLTPASAGYHNTSTALVIQDPRKLTRQTSCIGCRIQNDLENTDVL
jgi:hypothetical protein